MLKTVVYSTRIDPRTIASLARIYDIKKWRYRSASDLLNHAITTLSDHLIEVEENVNKRKDLRFESIENAIRYLLDNPRLDSRQLIKDFGDGEDRELSAREKSSLTESSKLADFTGIEPDEELLKRAAELTNIGRKNATHEE